MKSGGPSMTVETKQNGDKYWCVWYSDANNKHIGDSLSGVLLQKVLDQDPFDR
jgi:hypothetical protein